MKNLKEITEFRHTIKVYDETRKIPKNIYMDIMEFVRWSPTSFNFPVTRLVAISKGTKVRAGLIKSNAFEHNKFVVEQADKIIMFVIPKVGIKPDLDNRFVTEGVKYAAFQRDKLVSEVTDEDINMIKGNVMGAWHFMGFNDLGLWSTRQAYIKLGYLTAGAALQGVDTTSMEGYDPVALDKFMREQKLIEKDEQVIVAVGMGYRKDETSFNKSERKPMKEFLKEV